MSDVVYFCLMALGWFFLLGWSVALLTACAIAFRQEISVDRFGRAQQRPASVGGPR
jgi:hypothetical protein